ncbi:MAG TPA: hypothetical protein EYP39_01320, partial [Ghiorsea sp.]|nr:hypothetical protein [Ghiorsea sp.]
MTIKSILASVFALALFAGVGMTLTTANVSFVPAAYASSDDGSSDDGLAEGAACNCGSLTGVWVANADDGSSDDGSSDDGGAAVPGYCQCTAPGSGPA